MTIDPRISIILNIVMAFLIGIGGYLASNTAFMSTKAGLVTTLVIGALIAGINGVLHAIPSKPGAANEFPLGPKANP